jgi:glycosyltransferase involved in cell wall biosynthesis
VRVFHKEARTLARSGYQVIVIARVPAPKIVDGVQVLPVKTAGSSRFLRFLLLPAVFFQAVGVKADVYHLHNPDTLPIGLGLKMIGRKFIYDAHEDFAGKILIRAWIPAVLRRLAARVVVLLERFVSLIADGMIVTQPSLLGRVDRSAVLIGNPPRLEPELFSRVAKLAADINIDYDGLRAVYIGDITAARGLFEMVEALQIANTITPVRLWLIGPGSDVDLRAALELPGWRFVDHIPRLPPEQAFAYVSRADVGLVVIRDVGDHATTDPNKLYEYMAFGLPFIASKFKTWQDRLDGVTAGLFIRPGDARELAEAEIEIARNPAIRKQMGKKGRAFVESYSWERESMKLLDLYRRVLNSAADAGRG